MQHYFVKKVENILNFNPDDEHHIKNVMRMKTEDLIIGIVEGEMMYLASLLMDNQQIIAKIVKPLDTNNELDVHITLIYSLVKQEKFELVLQKATELGVKTIIPFNAKRSIVKITPQDEEKKQVRWVKILKEASEQSQRLIVPTLTKIHNLNEIIKKDYDIKLIAYEKESLKGSKNLFDLLTTQELKNKTIAIVVGPEGGFEEKEVAILNQAGYINVSLGKRILRTETAAIYALATMSFISERGS